MKGPTQLTPGMDNNTMMSVINNNFREIESESRTKIITDENGIPRVIIGRYPDGSYGIKVSFEGINVLEATDDQLYFNSAQNVFKIVDSGTAVTPTYSVTSAAAGTWHNHLGSPTVIPHGLDFTPSVIAFIDYDGQFVLLPTTFQSVVGTFGTGAAFNRVAINVDSTNLYVLDTTLVCGEVSVPYTGGGLDIKYYLLQESAD